MKPTRFRSANLRIGRHSIPDQIYMITAVTQDRKCWFEKLEHGRYVVNALKAAEPSADTLAYVVMPDHLHWLMQLKNRYSLSETVQFIKARSARELNMVLSRKGGVWGKGYFEHAIRRGEDVIGCARYIIANPLRTGLVEQIGDYPLWDAKWLGD